MARIEIAAEVTGKIWQIQLQEGAQVGVDDSIMVVESMKMEIPVVSTGAGRVLEILVKEGDSVEDGQVVAVIET
ncbi:acetyl-CoA carboxylase biotin carboxyl carrier protein subunit [Acidovorax sp. Be4]|uniref:Acetyl-CoA carboxylase biotin carboxyl carrier protein subunit n=1 Tax=Acidovorax bellezanensis TaxID=2976702 RepID=A0ABT2PJM1_9BURK|nr:acetyl-CoA carboxylase biotin carboxyl carrier protein subunit [Acidovorax sp. Be4]MCT9810690.1 acetyl-CoA carboxylase biotin carboxyl carrier protein subunit [Acidovorax sp. Be4]